MTGGYISKSKKILIIMTTPLRISGITTAVTNHIKYLDKEINEISLAFWHNTDKNILSQFNGKINFIELPSRYKIIKYIISLTRFIRSEEFDVIHVHGNSSSMILEMIASILGGVENRIVHSHSTQCNNQLINNLIKPFFKLTYHKALACSNESGRWLFKKNYTVIRNGFDLNTFAFDLSNRDSFRNELQIDENTIVLGMIGSLTKVKNHVFIIKTFEKIYLSGLNYKLVIIGDGELKSSLVYEVNRNKAKDSIVFLGKRSDISNLLSGIDIYLMPSLYEGLPFAALEAQASGLPCILSNKISEEVAISSLVNLVELDVNKWVDCILNTDSSINRKESSKKAISLLRYKGYDIVSEITELENIYSNIQGADYEIMR